MIYSPVLAVGDDGASGVIGGSPHDRHAPKLTLPDRGSSVAPTLDHPLVDNHLESVSARLRPNSTLAAVYDLDSLVGELVAAFSTQGSVRVSWIPTQAAIDSGVGSNPSRSDE